MDSHKRAKDDRRFRGSVDFSRMEEMRAERARCPTVTCGAAEAIFEAIAPLIAESATEAEKKHAITLAIQAVRLPHGERGDTIKAFLSIAPQPARAKLVLNLILSGETIPSSVVQAGINDVFEDAKKHTWILNEGWQLKAWLLLLPFTDHPAQLADTVAALPTRQREPHFLEELIRASGSVQTPEIEEALFKLAENDAAFYGNQAWRDAMRGWGTLSSARRYLDLVIDGKIDTRDGWHTSQQIAGLLDMHSELRDYAYGLLEDGTSPKTAMLAASLITNASFSVVPSKRAIGGFRICVVAWPGSGSAICSPIKTIGTLDCAPAKDSLKPSSPARRGRIGSASKTRTIPASSRGVGSCFVSGAISIGF